jgi:hypothetical protein
MEPLPKHIADKIQKDSETGCWEWLGSLSHNGYPMSSLKNKRIRVHRLTYERFVGEIPEGMQIDHLCKNTRCVNPDHLESVTQQVNIQRGVSATKTKCRKGHPLTGENLHTEIRKKTGTVKRGCKICRAEAVKRFKSSL